MFMFAAIIIMTGLIGFWGLMIGVPVFVILYTILHSEVDKRLGKKGLSVEQVDYYETEAGKELYREREYKRIRRTRGFKKKEEAESDEDFIIRKPNLDDTAEMEVCADTMEMNLYKDTMEMKLYKEKISESKTGDYKENPKKDMISK
jgi:hypothetical protein